MTTLLNLIGRHARTRRDRVTTLLNLICTNLLHMMYLKKTLVGEWYMKGSGSGDVGDEGVR